MVGSPSLYVLYFSTLLTLGFTFQIISVCWRPGSASAEKVGQVEMGGITRRVLCTRQLLGLAVKGPWLAPGGPIRTLAA